MNNGIKTKLENLHKYQYPPKLLTSFWSREESFNFDDCCVERYEKN